MMEGVERFDVVVEPHRVKHGRQENFLMELDYNMPDLMQYWHTAQAENWTTIKRTERVKFTMK